ncbi:hypothetical protein BKA66DRAFT_431478 [Pyrenochaeta sp. MPI-SDFR-AT-0127]|nr:hypothetical protein BKA66DRAFT_431478 [Pyrenochaeta sp. MPI-SDFR-AT-0127]
MFSKLSFSVTILLYPLTKAQSSLTPSDCVGTISSFPYCDAVNTNLARCNSLTEKQAIVDCICTQKFIDSWVGCKSEFRQCGLSTSFDSTFDSYLVEWHGACDTYLSISITTPPVAEPTATLEQGVCESFYESCDRWSKGTSMCTLSQSNDLDITSCRCSRSMLSLASVCRIDGSRSCLQSSVELTQLWEYQNCPGGSTLFVNEAVSHLIVVFETVVELTRLGHHRNQPNEHNLSTVGSNAI